MADRLVRKQSANKPWSILHKKGRICSKVLGISGEEKASTIHSSGVH
jgi:hypothetical protein